MDMKNRFQNDYDFISDLQFKPHFTVFNIIQPAHNEESLVKTFGRTIERISPFQIELHGFDYFPGPTYTLYVKLRDEKEFSRMAKYVRRFLKPILRPVKGSPPHYNTENAHLTIAKGILEPEFPTVWDSWKTAEYQSSTNADRMMLLRRPLTTKNFKYKIIGNCPFLGKGSLDPQISLF